MSSTVREIVHRELLSVVPGDSVESVLGAILAMGVTSAPVIDAGQHPIGVVSLRDLIGTRDGGTARDRMSTPALVVREDASIHEAARMIGASGHRHLVVVDGAGRATAMVSAVDVVRALEGLPARHPAAFPHLDEATGLVWTDDTELDLEHVALAPAQPGLLMLVQDPPGAPRRVVWVETAEDVRSRVIDLISMPEELPAMARWQGQGPLFFRAAAVADPGRRAAILEALQAASRPKLNANALL